MNTEQFYPIFLKAEKVTIDSRKIEKNDIFFAFSGDNFDAATLAEKAIEQGALAVIIENKEFENLEKNIFYVPSTLEFLQELSVHHRNQLNIPIIGLTGSNGKTTTKELIHAVLSEKYNVQYTFGNLNNHIGVPLTILSIKPEHEMAVIEMGANHQKEIELLCAIAKPNFGYITNFGKAHLEGFGGFEGVIKGKSELYDYLKNTNQTVLINENDSIQLEKIQNYTPKITFGKIDSDYYFEPFSENNFVGLQYQNQKALSKLTGEYNFTNLCAAASLGLYFGIDFNKIESAIESYTPTNMRSQVVKKGILTLVLDTYNANPSSMSASLHNFITFEGSKTIVIGDMLELGDESEKEHQNILRLAQNLGFNEIITVGKQFKNVNKNSAAFESTDELIQYLKDNKIQSENILLKASRGISLEKAIDFI
ncbi:UDP-N-acetylmuramoyl-tripeptide--D-alanyl-D-alanine ligase [Chryseobacterium sp. Ch-15]|uniref:UDP-N-acetylmuramoyl-tripeptide--D-alanyl-D-alanine ligase n=1 Tax=Chryseobacterium muglaense TaxID=2893752 RepID=A0A9Q3UVC8_9FLAO|nr:UDP-N-acetylmuramoyl-tripeptide--D-alanyl-D-alanine ligase [Chryseobacterium muglaense]MBD3906530.1 UDP-N-acetylmuramoyl-tripeptide--D-alanyl-D-alanine ligase [Chryseobacterium muglaense]MCC9034171.1 UDP-N-acetylmuramoyl-tripeptide--D-alanyl-D-alanine ligase [Chryseobacterium muglaense]MCM2556282.1 UDP-N-acetylmuramoyl-tripeptide--D-alanyl-D-alanine ligase [Chryseobacterium muglaense]